MRLKSLIQSALRHTPMPITTCFRRAGSSRTNRPALVALLILMLTAWPVLAVQPAEWNHSGETQFREGESSNIVATNLGDLKLSRQVKVLLENDPRISAVYALVHADDGTIYAGTGPNGIVLRLREDKVETLVQLGDGVNIFALGFDNRGRLLIGASGEQARLLRLDGDQPIEIFQPANTQYIWAMACAGDGTIYLATGPNGELHQLNPDGSSKVLLKTDEHNFLALAYDGLDTLYIGTDPNGLVYRINRRTGALFVLYDASESEISSLLIDQSGNLYAGASEAERGTGFMSGADEHISDSSSGRAEAASAGVPIPTKPPTEPQPPQAPNPNPNEPDPIPIGTTNLDQSGAPAGAPQSPTESAMAQPAPAQQEQAADTPASPRVPSPPAASTENHPSVTATTNDPSTAVTPVDQPHQINVDQAHTDLDTPDQLEPAGDENNKTEHASQAESDSSASDLPHRPVQPSDSGNAIYRIDTRGFITELFREPVMVLDMIAQDGKLIVATGSEGLIYQIDPAAEETTVLARLDAEQIVALLSQPDGRITLGLANTGGIATMSHGFAASGTYTSPVLDAAQTSLFGKMHVEGSLPQGTTLQASWRSGNMTEPAENLWSDWSKPVDVQQYMTVTAPSARFLQYRLQFATTDPQVSPLVNRVVTTYQLPNLSPQIHSISTVGGETETDEQDQPVQSPEQWTIDWNASDPNGDKLFYELHYRQGPAGPWIVIQNNLAEQSYEWKTRTLPDGRYYVRVTASDALANAEGQGRLARRVSDAFVIDNTPPVIGDLSHRLTGTSLEVKLRVVDRTSTVAGVSYKLDSASHWQKVLPSDSIYDSPAEDISFTISDLKKGLHQITIQASDSQGNHSYETVQVTVDSADTAAAQQTSDQDNK